MAITIGLDFGTHQTKICIENSDDPYHKTYEFYEWGAGAYAFPSIIQINKDHTLRYGSVDLDTCLVACNKKIVANPGELNLPPRPTEPNIPPVEKPKFPPQPVHTFVTTGGASMTVLYEKLYGIGCTLPRKKGKLVPINSPLIASDEQKREYQDWRDQCTSIKRQYDMSVEQRNCIISQHNKEIIDWKDECERIRQTHDDQKRKYEESLLEYPMVYRYFKQATFSEYDWDYEIKAQDLTVLYLANIIFKLEERFGTDFSIQMGIPASKETFSQLKSLASGYLIQAIRLVEDVFKNNYEKFLATPFEELLSLIPNYEYSPDLKMQYGLIILPEAYAALRSLTANSRIPMGMGIMLDMGGGTTDISFFTITDDGKLLIYHYESISKGLNFFLEYEDRHSSRSINFSKKKELEEIPNDVFNMAFGEFKGEIDTVVGRVIAFLYKDIDSRGFLKSELTRLLKNGPAIYTGGGCYDDRMRRPILDVFDDVKYIDKGILGIPNVVDESKVSIPYSLMATAFGLSLSIEDDEIKLSTKEDLFAAYPQWNEQDFRWDAHREHGMYED